MNLATDQNSGDHNLSRTATQFLTLREPVMARWEREIRSRVEGAEALLSPVLINTLPAFYNNIAEALGPGHSRHDATSNNNSATAHGSERARMTPFGPDQIIHEYQILRESIAVEAAGQLDLTRDDWAIIDRSINQAIREAVCAFIAIQEDLRGKLAGALSHDMRTPLSVIVNAAQLIELANDLPSAKILAQKIQSNSRRLENMMSDLLDALTSTAGEKLPLSLSTFGVGDLIEETRSGYAQPGGLDIQTRIESVHGCWCRDSMRRALENLINNASAYGDGGPILIASEHAHGRLMLTVHNTGEPIAKERQNQIFEYFTRSGGSSFTSGWGLGLPFVKRVAESHGGSVAVDSSAGTGTTFLIDIPIDARPYVEQRQQPATNI